MARKDLITLARIKASEAGLDPALVCAIVEQESAWKPTATRFEPAFKKRYVDPLKLEEQEAIERSTSWGLMQVMGQVAREFGYDGPLHGLLEPEVGLTWGCKVFKQKFQRAKADVQKALLFWNGGGRLAYADEVEARIPKYEDPKGVL